MNYKPLVSYIIPTYQAESFICNNLNLFSKYCMDSNLNSEIVIVNDGSTDGTNEIIKNYIGEKKDNLSIKYINLQKNKGKGSAIKKGVEVAEGEYIVFTDCDLPYSFKDIGNVVYSLMNNKADVVIASRMHKDSIYKIKSSNISYIYIRHTAGRVFNWLVKWLTRLNIDDTQAGLKGFNRGVAEIISEKVRVSGFSFDVDLLMCAKGQGKKIHTVPIEHNYNSEMSTVKFVEHTFKMSFDLLRIFLKRITGYYKK